MSKVIRIEDDTSVYIAHPYEGDSWVVQERDAETNQELSAFTIPGALIAAIAAQSALSGVKAEAKSDIHCMCIECEILRGRG